MPRTSLEKIIIPENNKNTNKYIKAAQEGKLLSVDEKYIAGNFFNKFIDFFLIRSSPSVLDETRFRRFFQKIYKELDFKHQIRETIEGFIKFFDLTKCEIVFWDFDQSKYEGGDKVIDVLVRDSNQSFDKELIKKLKEPIKDTSDWILESYDALYCKKIKKDPYYVESPDIIDKDIKSWVTVPFRLGPKAFGYAHLTKRSRFSRRQLSRILWSCELVSGALRISYQYRDIKISNELYGMISDAHGIREILAGVLNSAEMLMKGNFDTKEDIRKIATINYKSSGRATNLFNQFVNFASYHYDKSRLDSRAKVDLSELLNDAIETHRYTFQKKNIEIIADIPKEQMGVYHEGSISAVCHSIIGNQAKYTEEGTKAVVRLERLEDDFYLMLFYNKGIQNFFGTTVKGTGWGTENIKNVVAAHGGIVYQDYHTFSEGTSLAINIPTGFNPE